MKEEIMALNFATFVGCNIIYLMAKRRNLLCKPPLVFIDRLGQIMADALAVDNRHKETCLKVFILPQNHQPWRNFLEVSTFSTSRNFPVRDRALYCLRVFPKNILISKSNV